MTNIRRPNSSFRWSTVLLALLCSGVPATHAQSRVSAKPAMRPRANGQGASGPMLTFYPRPETVVAGEAFGPDGYGDGNIATSARVPEPYGVALDSAGNLFIAVAGTNTIRRVDAVTHIITTVAGIPPSGDDGGGALDHRPHPHMQGTDLALNRPQSVVADSAGNLYIASTDDHIVYRLDTSGMITPFAGTYQQLGYSGDSGAATLALLDEPTGLSLDASGNLYIADSGNSVIRRVDAATGTISTFAGNSSGGGFSGDGTPATSAQLSAPEATAFDPQGNLFIADTGNMRIRRVDGVTGIITTVAGNGTENYDGYDGDLGPATSASIDLPYGIAVDPAGSIFFTDRDTGVVRRVDPAGNIHTVTLQSDRYYSTTGLTLSSTSALYFATAELGEIIESGGGGAVDFGSQPIGSSTTQQLLLYNSSTSALQFSGFSLKSARGFTLTATSPGSCNLSGTLAAGASCTVDLTFAPTDGTLYSGEIDINDNAADTPQGIFLTGYGQPLTPSVTLAITPASIQVGSPATFSINVAPSSGSGPVPTGTALLDDQSTGNPIATLTLDANGNASYTSSTLQVGSLNFYVEYLGDNIYADTFSPIASVTVLPNSATITLQSSATTINYGDPLTLTANLTSSNTLTGNADFYVDGALLGSGAINPQGVATLTVSALPVGVHNVQARYNNPAFGVTVSNSISITIHGGILQFNPMATYTLAGTPGSSTRGGFSGDNGPGTLAKLNTPVAVAVDPAGNAYIADELNNVIRRVDSSGVITTYAGTPYTGSIYYTRFSGDGGPALNAYLDNPNCLTFDSGGNLYICDYSNNVIRRVDSVTHVITTVAGSGSATSGYNGNTGVATSVYLLHPSGIAFDQAGNMYIADTGNNLIRKVDPSGNLTTIAGNYYYGRQSNPASGVLATSTTLYTPTGIVVDASGNVLFSDSYYQVVRRIDASTQIITTFAGGNYTYSAPWGDGGAATSATLDYPQQLSFDAAGNLYIVDSSHNLIRRVDSTGTISTVVGIVGYSGSGALFEPAGLPATDSPLDAPYGIAIDATGALYITDTYNQTVLKTGPAGTVVFGPQSPGTTSAPQTLTLLNIGDLPITFGVGGVSPYSVSGPYTASAGGPTPCNFTATLAARSSCTMQVAYAPASANSAGGTLTFNSSAVAGPQIVHLVTNLTTTATTTAYQAYPSPASVGDSVVLYAQVTGTTVPPTGTVTFYNGTTSLGTATLSSGFAYIITTTLPAGNLTSTAVYSGDVFNSPSTSDPITISISLPSSSTVLAVTSTAINIGASLGLTATVTSSNATPPTGTVTFFDGSAQLGTATLDTNGVATLSTSGLNTGSNSITAHYNGNAALAASTSSAIVVQVTGSGGGGGDTSSPYDFDYTIITSSLPGIIHRGDTVTILLSVQMLNNFPGQLTLSCGTLPSYATCTFSPASVSLPLPGGGTEADVIWTITTTPRPAGARAGAWVKLSQTGPHALPPLVFEP